MTYYPPTALPRDLLADDGVQRALGAHDFGAVFRVARERAGISYSKIAAECDIAPGRVGTLARGQGRITSFEKIVQIADALRVPGYLVGLAPRPWEAPVAPAGLPHAENGPAPVHRRTILRAATTSSLAAALPALRRPPTPHRVTDADVDLLQKRTARLRRLDDVLGGGDTRRVYLGEVQHTKELLRRASFTGQSRRRLTALLAEQAQQAGWAAFDGGRPRDAVGFYEESRDAARDAHDTDLYGNSLAFLAYEALADDRRTAATFAQDSCATITTRTPATVRALLHERLAWACAVNGDAGGTERALTAARQALADAQDGEPQPGWSTWVDQNELDIMTGRCWTELSRPLRAVPVLTAALGRFTDDHARDKALYLTWLAEAYLTAGEIEEAATATLRSLQLAAGVASIRPRQRITPLLDRLRPHTETRQVRDLLAFADG
ncbi:helix-turn-helix protein [Streptomyces sp. KhCrAH-43]|uniref:helix-turn-helix domain-containing protein n=1 Tax=unclassified Streptomyces TaxID=2593676 RepID=UPI00035ED1C7|nr:MULTISPECIES: helix-turn-helix transcriptional regulator [unclassified Streptomyces]MYS32869.1 helix-turn-helix domain-containing protein [Streptomyces sp. SID4920]MYX64202.1 helix-turn-helix domain-containing protein [Streptomyces sp. SID8373]RAJ47825.1 helix-turn-helix protein [Streptomyces sp. KhCrAH-43]